MLDALVKLPETLNQIFNVDKMTEEVKRNAFKAYIQELIDSYTDENGVTYNHIYRADLNRRQVRQCSLNELDKYINQQEHTASLIEALQETVEIGKLVYGANLIDVYAYNGIIVFEAFFPNGEFKFHIGYEED